MKKANKKNKEKEQESKKEQEEDEEEGNKKRNEYRKKRNILRKTERLRNQWKAGEGEHWISWSRKKMGKMKIKRKNNENFKKDEEKND